MWHPVGGVVHVSCHIRDGTARVAVQGPRTARHRFNNVAAAVQQHLLALGHLLGLGGRLQQVLLEPVEAVLLRARDVDEDAQNGDDEKGHGRVECHLSDGNLLRL